MPSPTSCTITGNVINMLGSNVQGCTITVSTTVPFIHPTNGSWVSGEISSTTTSSDGNFSITCIETTTPGVRVKFTFDYYDGTANRRQKTYSVLIPNQSSAVLTDLITAASNPVTSNTFPASSVTLNPSVAGETYVQDALEAVAAGTGITLASGKILVGNGSNIATAVTPSGDVTIDTSGVTSIGTGVIVNADVSASAGIARSKTASGTAYRVVANDSSGVMSENAAITASRAVASDANGQLVAATTTATELDYVSGVTSAIQTQINTKAPSASPTFTGTVTTPLSTAGPVLTSAGGVLSSEAQLAVARGGTNSGTALNNNRVMQSSSGAIVEAAAITASRALASDANGIPVASSTTATELGYVNGVTSAIQTQLDAKIPKTLTTTTGDMIYASSANTPARLAIGSTGQVLKVSGGIPSWGTASGGSGGINYLSANPDAETDTSGWSTYADAAGTQPVDGTGGSPTTTWTRSTSSPLRGTANFLLTKDAANRQGEGVAYAITLDSADQAKPLTVSFDYTVASGTYADGDLTVYLYDVTNSTVIQPAPYRILSAAAGLSQKWIGYFQTSAASTSYRLIIHTASTSASAYTVKFDNFNVSPTYQPYGAVITDWQSFTPTSTWVSNATHTGRWRRVGDSAQVQVSINLTGTPTSATLVVNMPSGLVIDSAKIPSAAPSTSLSPLGMGLATDGDDGSGSILLYVAYSNTGAVIPLRTDDTSAGVALNTVTATTPFAFDGPDYLDLEWTVPIVGWSSNVQMSSDADTRVVAARYSLTSGGSYSSSATIVWNNKIFDTHGALNTGTGIYTVPVAGVYRVSAHLLMSSLDGSTDASMQFIHTSQASGQIYGSRLCGGGTTQCTVSGTELFNCIAGDQIYVQSIGDASYALDTGGNRCQMTIERLSGPAQIAASEKVYLQYTGNAGTALTANTTNIDWATKVVDSHNAFSGTVFTAPRAGFYAFSGMVRTGSSTLSVLTYINGTVKLDVSYDLSSVFKLFSGGHYLNAGDTLSFRSDTNATLSNSSQQCHITIWSQG